MRHKFLFKYLILSIDICIIMEYNVRDGVVKNVTNKIQNSENF